jgi:hypothetical protein
MGLSLETISILLRVFMPILLFLFWVSMGAVFMFVGEQKWIRPIFGPSKGTGV